MDKQGISLPVNANKIMEDLNASREGMFSFYPLAHKIKADNKLKELQYRILTFTYNTNCLLFKKKLCSTVFCDFCAVERETVYHLYYDCTFVSCFLKQVEIFWRNNTQTHLSLSRKDIILGNTSFSDLLNLVILLEKSYIHLSKISSTKPKFELFIPTLRDRYSIEKSIFFK